MISVILACALMLVIAAVALLLPDQRIEDLKKKSRAPSPYC